MVGGMSAAIIAIASLLVTTTTTMALLPHASSSSFHALPRRAGTTAFSHHLRPSRHVVPRTALPPRASSTTSRALLPSSSSFASSWHDDDRRCRRPSRPPRGAPPDDGHHRRSCGIVEPWFFSVVLPPPLEYTSLHSSVNDEHEQREQRLCRDYDDVADSATTFDDDITAIVGEGRRGADEDRATTKTTTIDLVKRRIDASRIKYEIRRKSINDDRERNLRLRGLFMAEERESGGHDDDVGGDRICSDAYGGDDVVDDDNDEDDEDEDEEDTNYVGRSSASSPDITMFAVKVVTCGALRAELKMTGREKRGRMFVERPSDFDVNYDNNRRGDDRDDDSSSSYACNSVAALRRTIHEFFRRLKKSTYVLSASLPTFDVDGNMLTHPETDDDDDNDYNVKGGADDVVDCDNTVGGGTWSLESDDDVRLAFVRAEEFYREHRSSATTMMKRPTLVLHVTKDPNASPPRSPPSYLRDMPDPLTSGTMTMLSFYSFPPGGIPDPEKCAELLRRRWRPFRALGRVYVATEGVNAQMAVPTNVLSAFLRCCSIPSPSSSDDAVVDDDGDGELSNVLGRHVENGINVDPVPVDSAVFASDPPFRNLHVRVRAQIVADGLDAPLNWQGAGYDMPPLEWHRRLKEARDAARNDDDDGGASTPPPPLPIVLDCRNGYETQVGRFELAEPLGTENFRESWDVLRERLRDVPKDAPIMTYCTGGIRCVKVNAYLTQEMEFTNVSRLAGGVVAYDRILGEQLPDEEPMFKGVNFVFDGRMGRKITDDKLGTCHTCGEATNFITNCRNDNCHKRIVQCERCGDSFLGTCSEACKTRVVNAGMAPMRNHRIGPSGERGSSASAEDGGRVEGTGDGANYSSLDDYSSAHSTVQPPLLREIESNTRRLLPTGAHMVSGSMQGSLLTTLASVSREGRILEIGTFTGYATACFLLGAAQAGASLGASTVGTRYGGGPFVLSLERDRSALGLASAHLRAMTEYGIGEEGATRLRDIGPDEKDSFTGESVSFIFNDVAGCELLRVNDALATVEEMASHNPAEAAFDIVFVDADKTRLIDYVNALVGNDRVLKRGGLILVDNVLWKGLVMDASGSGYESSGDETSEDEETLRRNRRARKLANKMHRFNSAVVTDERVEVLMMNIRDGLSLIRKR